ncbi:hypothetical protein niasHT_025160 [Heterodera trifolii]|uniref:Uncharacterized protein n=1 Tax=Heterodera trifolii TaxID=157864 RepID=A0ABD2JLA2_9BILA
MSQLINFFDAFKHRQQKPSPATTTDGENKNNNGTPTATQTPTRTTTTTTTFLFTVHSEYGVELSFRLPRHHFKPICAKNSFVNKLPP